MLIQTYFIRDVDYYATENTIKSTWTKVTSVQGRAIYLKPIATSPLNIDSTTSYTIEFKYSSISNANTYTSVVGVDLYSDSTRFDIKCGVTIQNGSLKSYYSSSSSYRNKDGYNTTPSASSVYKITYNGNTKTTTWYKDDVQFAQYTTEATGNSTLRYDLFDTNSSILEYIIIKK